MSGLALPTEAAFAANALERLLLYLAMEGGSQQVVSQSLTKIEGLVRQIRSSPLGDWDFAKSARKLRMSNGHFARLFKESTSLPPKQFLLKCRMDLAAEMLATTTEPIKSVAGSIGFEDLQYFYRKFRAVHRLTPAEFRGRFSKSYRIGVQTPIS